MDEKTLLAHLDDLFKELDELLKRPEAAEAFAARGVNTSIALVAAHGLLAYLQGDRERAAEDLGTAAEEVASRLEASRRLKADSN